MSLKKHVGKCSSKQNKTAWKKSLLIQLLLDGSTKPQNENKIEIALCRLQMKMFKLLIDKYESLKAWLLRFSPNFCEFLSKKWRYWDIFWPCIHMSRIRWNSFVLETYIILIKIILHRIISVVWITNFLSEIRSLTIHDDETKCLLLSVKPIQDLES